MPGIFAVLAFVVVIRGRSLLHPAVLWTGSWAFSGVLYSLRLLPYRNLSWLTTGLICGAIASFVVGSSLGARIRPRRVQRDAGTQVEAVELAAWLLLGLLGVTVLVFMAQLASRFGVGQVLKISASVRQYLISGEAPLSSIYVEVAIAAATMCGLAAATVSQRARKRAWLAASIACAGSVYFSTSRAFIVFAVIAAFTACLLTGAVKVSHRQLAFGAAAVVVGTLVLFTGLGSLLGKTYGNSTIGEFDNFFSRHPVARSLALPYEDATASIPALDVMTSVSSTWGVAHGCATAPIACGVLRKAGVNTLRVPVAGQFTQVPLQWNGYTFLDRFLIDFGTGLALLAVALTGVLAGYCWQRARRGSLANIIVYAMSVPGLLIAYRQNLIEIVFVAAVIAVGTFWLSTLALDSRLQHADRDAVRRLSALLRRLLAPPSHRVAVLGPALEQGPRPAGTGRARLRALRSARIAETRPRARGRRGGDGRRAAETRPRPRGRRGGDARSAPETRPAGATRQADHAQRPAPPPPAEQARPSRRARRPPPTTAARPPERIDVARGKPRTKEEWEHYVRYVWASRIVHGTVLDVACGTGYGTRLLARSARVTGIDRDEAAVRLARSRSRSSFIAAAVPPIPIRSFAFTFVVCFETVEHIEDDREFMREIARVLLPHGKLLISTVNAQMAELPGQAVNPWHTREHTWESLTALIEGAGLVVRARHMQSFLPLLPRGHRLAWRMQPMIRQLPAVLRVPLRPIFGDLDVRRFKAGSRAPAYLLLVAEKPA